MNITLSIRFGKRASSTSDSLFQAVMNNLEKTIGHADMVRDMKTFLPAFSIFDYLFRPGMNNFIEKDTNPLYRPLINEAFESNVDCFVKKLRELDHMDEKSYDNNDDTIAVTAAWALVILCCYQDTQRAVRKEVDQFIVTHKRLPSFTDRDHLPLLVSVQKEFMRYRMTSAFGLLHNTLKDVPVTCRGYFIRKGTTIVSNMRAIHTNPDVYDDPEKFMPERFMNRLKPMATCAHSNPQARDHFAKVEIYNILVRLLAKTAIETIINKEGNPICPDLDKLDDAGGLILPKDRGFRINKRTGSLTL
ncbi:cytochrome P450 [Circinella umbellata]|nr:cytochrome P450 [Circinella umbellata]